MIYSNKIILIIISLIFWFGCISSISSGPGVSIRHTINECKVFDCSILSDEIELLKYMVYTDDINQGIQQSLVTTITKKCRDNDIKIGVCDKYIIERKQLYGRKYLIKD